MQNLPDAGVGTVPQKETDIQDVQGPFIAGTEGDRTVEPREQSDI